MRGDVDIPLTAKTNPNLPTLCQRYVNGVSPPTPITPMALPTRWQAARHASAPVACAGCRMPPPGRFAPMEKDRPSLRRFMRATGNQPFVPRLTNPYLLCTSFDLDHR